jgi:UDP-4-amino-4,6-dideoxy-N-acetyl-beta-L-altrosamine transaminase
MIPYGRQDITPADIEAVVQVLRSDFLTQGPTVPAFEAAVAKQVHARHATAMSSATAALHVACLALDLGPGDWLWTSPITFVASSNCALYCGAQVDFVDIDPRTYNLCPQALERKLFEAKRLGRLPKVVVPVHLCGQPCELERIHELAQEYGFRIIEDASHAIGGRYKNDPIGNSRYSDVTVFSFHPVKIITTAEGGMALTNNDALAKKMALLRSHGITRDPALMTRAPEGGWYYEQIALGYNYRMTDVQAALGLSQLSRVDEYVARRHEQAARYDSLLAPLPLVTPWQHPDSYSGRHLYVIRLKPGAGGKTHRQVFAELHEAGVGVNLHYIPVYRQPYYEKMGFAAGLCPEAEKYYQEAITLPLFPTMTDEQQDQVVATLARALRA